jgi:type IV pilus assembly protein PilC
MPSFSYRAINNQNAVVQGTIESTDKNTAVAALIKQGLKPLTVQSGTGDKRKSGGFGPFKPKVKTSDLVIFTRQLSTMVSAGVPLARSLNTLGIQAENKAMKAVLAGVVKDVEAGMALGDAFAKYPEVFSDIYVNMVRAGEAAGILDDILKRLAAQVEKNASIRKKIKSAMTYPIVLLVITVVAFFGLMLFVIPRIGAIIKDLSDGKADLPLVTKVMLAISDFMVARWYILLVVIVGGVFVTRRYLKTPAGKLMFHHLVLRLPIIKPLITKVAVARFARTFASLIGAGVSVLEALRITGKAIGNKVYEAELIHAAEAVKNGKELSKAIEGSKLFPPIVSQMLAVGEETGQTDTVLVKVADFYEEEVDAMVDGLSSIIEPVMIVLMGSMVGLIAASVMGPIANLSKNIGN